MMDSEWVPTNNVSIDTVWCATCGTFGENHACSTMTITVPSSLDTQVGGNHYREYVIQPIEFITKNRLDFLQGNIIKYVCRHRQKGGAEDIRKIIHYAQHILELEYGEKP
jgi:hypothetical protein